MSSITGNSQFSRRRRGLEKWKGSCVAENYHFCFMTTDLTFLLGTVAECSYEADQGTFLQDGMFGLQGCCAVVRSWESINC